MSKLFVDEIASKTGTADALTIDSAGRILTPARPAFHARITASGTEGKTGTLVFNAEDFDIGGNYDTSNGRFTAPTAGVYYFCYDALVSGSSGGGVLPDGTASYFQFIKNGSEGNWSKRSYAYTLGAAQYNTMHLVECIQLAASDYVQVKVSSQYAYVDASGNYDPTFQGFLLG